MKHIQYQTSGTCSKLIDVEVDDDNRLADVHFTGGCDGNLKGITQLVRGMKVEEIKQRLSGITCGKKGTSCPDQLTKALEEMGY